MIIIGNSISRAAAPAYILALLLCMISYASGLMEYDPREVLLDRRSIDKTQGNNLNSDTDKSKCNITGMWFGPRLGKRHRVEEKLEVNPEIESLVDVLDGAHWVVITIPGSFQKLPIISGQKILANDKKQSTKFTPRLGRESGEDLLSYGGSRDGSDFDEDDQLPPLFAPRLGRKLPWTPSPRLGRQLQNILSRKI